MKQLIVLDLLWYPWCKVNNRAIFFLNVHNYYNSYNGSKSFSLHLVWYICYVNQIFLLTIDLSACLHLLFFGGHWLQGTHLLVASLITVPRGH